MKIEIKKVEELLIEELGRLEALVLGEWELPEEGICIRYECRVDAFGLESEKTEISFPSGWGSRRKANKISWLMSQAEVWRTPYLLRALEVAQL